jgi:hypothetical protein
MTETTVPAEEGASTTDEPERQALAKLRASDAEFLDAMAAGKRATAEAAVQGGGDPLFAARHLAEAAGIEGLATALRDPDMRGVPALYAGHGGEVAPKDDPDMGWKQREMAQRVTGHAGELAADASLERLTLARDAAGLPLALEAAGDAEAQTAVEKMLAHQLAAAHVLAMGLFTAAQGDVARHRAAPRLNTGAMVEATRNAHAAARVLDAFARGALALDRLRHGARQTVVVERMVIQDGGQAVVAGSVEAGGGRRRRGG